jgi:hypothetical protein
MFIGQSVSEAFERIHAVIVLVQDDGIARNAASAFQGGMGFLKRG